MLTHPTFDQLNQLGLLGMAGAFGDVIDADTASLSHAEWLALLLEREISHRHDKRLAARLRYAKLRHQAAVEDVDYRAVRGLDRALLQKLATGAWIDTQDNLILCGPTGEPSRIWRSQPRLLWASSYFLTIGRIELRIPFWTARHTF